MSCRLTALGLASTLSNAKLSRLDSTRMRSAPRQKKKGRSNTQLQGYKHNRAEAQLLMLGPVFLYYCSACSLAISCLFGPRLARHSVAIRVHT